MTSKLNQTRSTVNSVVAELNKHRKQLNVEVLDVVHASSDLARITAKVIHAGSGSLDATSILESLSATLKNKVRPIENTFSVLSSNPVSTTITGVVSLNPEAIPFTQDMNGYKVVAGNMFMDDSDQLWTLRKTEAGDFLIKSRGKNDAEIMSEIMSCLSSASDYESISAASSDEDVRSSLAGGDFITFVNPQNEEVCFGAIVASIEDAEGNDNGLCVLASDADEPVQIDRTLVLGAFADVEMKDEGIEVESATASAEHNLEFISSYYSRMFQRDPSYYEKFMARWKAHVFA